MRQDNIIKRRNVFMITLLALVLTVAFTQTGFAQSKWTRVLPEKGGINFRAAVYGEGLFVGVGDGGVIVTSTNGTSWTARSSKTNYNIYAVNYGNGRFVAVGYHGLILTSDDGKSWTKRVAYSLTGKSLTSVAYGNGIWVTGGVRGKVRTSSNNGASWTFRETGTVHEFRGMAYGNGYFVAACSAGNIFRSKDGKSWSRIDIGSENLYSACFGDGKFMVGGQMGALYTSTDSSKWTKLKTNTNNYLMDIVYTGSYFLACGNSDGSNQGSLMLYSSNGTSWTRASMSAVTIRSLLGLATNGSIAIVMGAKRTVAKSTLGGGGSASITVTAPKSGDEWDVNTQQSIRWTSSGLTRNVTIHYSVDGGRNWLALDNDTRNDGIHTWTVGNTPSDNCLVRIRENDGSPSAVSGVFTIGSSNWIGLTSPNGGESWDAGSTQNITWTSEGDVGNIRVQYSLDNGNSYTTLSSAEENDGSYSWTLDSDLESKQALVRLLDSSNSSISDTSTSTFTINRQPALKLDKTQFNFGYTTNGSLPSSQQLGVLNSGGGVLQWDISSDSSWLVLDAVSGSGAGYVNVSIDPSGLGIGSYTGTITVSSSNAENGPLSATVNLGIKSFAQDNPPFGALATPDEGLVAGGSVPITGWVLDDVEVTAVRLFYNQNSYIGDAVFVEGQRTDIVNSYPTYPNNSKAGWGYMLLTNSLPDGAYRVYAVAVDNAGNEVELGYRNITIDNASATDPFGALDAPAQGGVASGSNYVNWGWALTPQPNKIAENGSTIQVWVDSLPLGTPSEYNVANTNVAALFPGYANTGGPTGYLHINTTAYENGSHQISWTVTDNAGNSSGIGSRFFNIRNTGTLNPSNFERSRELTGKAVNARRAGSHHYLHQLARIPGTTRALGLKRGFDMHAQPRMVAPDVDTPGLTTITLTEKARIELHLNVEAPVPYNFTGYLVAGETLMPLPAGSTLEGAKGIFHWQAGPGFVGTYDLIFIGKSAGGDTVKKSVRVRIDPMPSNLKAPQAIVDLK